jgi:hypothetical protein
LHQDPAQVAMPFAHFAAGPFAVQVCPALVHKYTQPIEFIMFFDLKQKNVTH